MRRAKISIIGAGNTGAACAVWAASKDLGDLVLMVVLSGYENSISKLDLKGADRPSWLGKLDASGLKQKVFGSIVAISAIQLLRVFMQVDKATERDLWWSSGIHMVFVVSAILLSLSDRISAGAKKG